jgi:hypothetical protein
VGWIIAHRRALQSLHQTEKLMSRAHVYRILVPDAPLHRRTDRDTFPDPEFARRVDATNFLRERTAQPGLQTPRLISSFAGSIDALLFVFPRYVVSDDRLVAASSRSTGCVPKRFVVVHHESSRRQWKGGSPARSSSSM